MLEIVAVFAVALSTYSLFNVYTLIASLGYLVVAILLTQRFHQAHRWLTLVLFAAMPILAFGDVMSHGPYSRYHNFKLQPVAQTLVGRPQSAVRSTLGDPTSVFHDDNGLISTYNYSPFPWFPFAKLQAHCESGFVVSIELFDD